MAEKRKEPRKSLIARAEVLWEDGTGVSRIARAMIEDTSPNGMCIRISKQIAVGSKIEIKSHRERALGVVKTCRKDGFEYVLGIEREAP
jgi:PilZ domain